ncbi:peptidoglycan bridge formation glycyltransferase FemA/FemB family protein [Patescibacteria group bacterium]|nr:peptidoglycan bridge formation glycyltransferase FemA/FemB family protein [Patescibacteria group bacterium]
MSTVKQIDDKKIWNNFLLNQLTQTGIFLQSAEWLDFLEAMGHKTYRLGLSDEQNNLVAIFGVTKNSLPFRKNYFYCPRGPVMNYELGVRNYEFLIEKISEIAKKENGIFLRLEPPIKFQVSNFKFQEITPIQPKHTLVLDLTKSEDDLLAAMHEKTRYNIRLAEKKNLVLKNENFEDFWKLMKTTTERDKFSAHPKEHYQTMLEKISGDGKTGMRTELKIVYSGDTPLAAAIIGYFGDTATYIHGASSSEFRNLMAPYFLHWEIIGEAKNLGYKFYDFWGIGEVKWPGVTRFKKGFGGFEINYPGTFDLPINKLWYTIYNLARKIL